MVGVPFGLIDRGQKGQKRNLLRPDTPPSAAAAPPRSIRDRITIRNDELDAGRPLSGRAARRNLDLACGGPRTPSPRTGASGGTTGRSGRRPPEDPTVTELLTRGRRWELADCA